MNNAGPMTKFEVPGWRRERDRVCRTGIFQLNLLSEAAACSRGWDFIKYPSIFAFGQYLYQSTSYESEPLALFVEVKSTTKPGLDVLEIYKITSASDQNQWSCSVY